MKNIRLLFDDDGFASSSEFNSLNSHSSRFRHHDTKMSGEDNSSGSTKEEDENVASNACPQPPRCSKTSSLLAAGMRNLILEYGMEACQEQLDAYRRDAASASAAAAECNGGDGSGCPMNFVNNNSQEKISTAVVPPPPPPLFSDTKRNSILNDDDNHDSMGDMAEQLEENQSVAAAQRLAFQLEHDAQLNHDIIEASFDGVFLVNDFGIIRTVNASALAKFGYQHASELVGRNIRVICGIEHAHWHDQYMERYRLTRETRIIGSRREVQARRKDGTEFPCKIGIKVMERKGSNELLMVGFVRDLTWEKRTLEMKIEAKIAEKLLVNMLPAEIAMRLKNNGDPHHHDDQDHCQELVADHHDSATILFADIVGFTSMSSRIAPIEVVRLLNGLFGRFDKLVDKYDLNKVKTIGDCYMVTSIPSQKSPAEMAAAVCAFGLDILDELHDFINTTTTSSQEETKELTEQEKEERLALELRVGINSGPVVAGIIGTKRYMYDIWGDSVNVASRMESTGLPGKVQVTKEVVELVASLGEGLSFVKRGLVDIKGKGRVETFFLEKTVAI